MYSHERPYAKKLYIGSFRNSLSDTTTKNTCVSLNRKIVGYVSINCDLQNWSYKIFMTVNWKLFDLNPSPHV